MVARVASQNLVLVIAMLMHCNAGAETALSTLAQFIDGENSLQNLIEFPAVDGDVSKTIFCESRVYKSGKLRRTLCPASSKSDRYFIEAIETAAMEARVTPATLNGKAKRTSILYSVMFVRQGGVEAIGVYPNWGHDVEKYGPDYESAQRYDRGKLASQCKPASLLLVIMKIGADGRISGEIGLSVSDGEYGKTQCVGLVRDHIIESSYIAGRHNGEPVETTHVFISGHLRPDKYEPVIDMSSN